MVERLNEKLPDGIKEQAMYDLNNLLATNGEAEITFKKSSLLASQNVQTPDVTGQIPQHIESTLKGVVV